MFSLIDALFVLIAGLAAAGWFAASTALLDQVPDAVLVAVALLGGGLVVGIFAGLPTPSRLRRVGSPDAVRTALAGVAAFAAVPLLVLACRWTDAPSGAETLFFTTSAWGLLGVLVAAMVPHMRPSLTQGAGALVALLGSAAIVANWERPSSFSPFMKFPLLELGMLGAGLLFIGASVVLSQQARRHGARTVLSIAWSAALVVALVYALVMAGPAALVSMPGYLFAQVALAAASLAALGMAWVSSLERIGLARASSARYVPPVALTLVSLTEMVARAYGINPVQWPGALAGCALVALGVVTLLLYAAEDRNAESTGFLMLARGGLAGRVVAVFAVLLGTVALAMPAFHARITGELAGKRFDAAWLMVGVESAAGWLPLVTSLLALAVAVDSSRNEWSRAKRAGAVAIITAAALTWPLLLESALRTWTLWLPSEVLQDLGTEYARMDLVPIRQPFGLAALACAISAAVITTVVFRAPRPVRNQQEGVA